MTAAAAQPRYAVQVIEDTLLEAIEKMEKAVDHVQGQFTTVRTGRANPALVDKLQVEYYGSMVQLQQLAGFQVPEARTLEAMRERAGWLGEVCKARGYRYAHRLHIELYGNKRGT